MMQTPAAVNQYRPAPRLVVPGWGARLAIGEAQEVIVDAIKAEVRAARTLDELDALEYRLFGEPMEFRARRRAPRPALWGPMTQRELDNESVAAHAVRALIEARDAELEAAA